MPGVVCKTGEFRYVPPARAVAAAARQLSDVGIIVLHYPPRRLGAEPRVVVAEIRSTLDAARDRPLQPFRAVTAR